MKELIKYQAAIITIAAVLLSACGAGKSPSEATAEVVLGTIFESKASSPEELEMLKSMSEYQQAVQCLANHLDQNNWGTDDFDRLMTETNDTGNIQLIDPRKFSEAEQMRFFGPILTSPCL